MDPIPQHPRQTDLRQRLARLTIEVREVEDELALLESDDQRFMMSGQALLIVNSGANLPFSKKSIHSAREY